MTVARQIGVNVAIRAVRKRHVPGYSLFILLPLSLIKMAILVPLALLEFGTRLKITTYDPDKPRPPRHGISTLSGRPMRTWKESLAELKEDVLP